MRRLLAIDSKIHMQVAMVGFGATIENFSVLCITSSAQDDDLLQVVTYAEVQVCPVLHVLCPQTLVDVEVWRQKLL